MAEAIKLLFAQMKETRFGFVFPFFFPLEEADFSRYSQL